MKINHLFTTPLLLGGLILFSCSNDETGNGTPDVGTPILLTSGVDGTRAGLRLQNDALDVASIIDVQIKSVDTKTTYDLVQYQVADEDGTLTPVKKVYPYYPVNGSAVNIYAIYPEGYSNASSFEVKGEQVKAADYRASDLMYAEVTNQSAQAAAVTLPFKHKLSKVIVKLTPDSEEDLADSEVRLLNVYTRIGFTPSTGELGELQGSRTSVLMSKDGSEDCAAIIVPQEIPSGVFIEVRLSNNDIVNYKTIQTTPFEGGKKYTYNITVKEATMTAATTIEDWELDTEEDVETRPRL